MSVLVSGKKTPIIEVKFCNLLKPFFYPNSPNVPRYSVTCTFDPEMHKEFLASIQTIESREGVESALKSESKKNSASEYESTGKVIVKFQTKNKIPVFAIENKAAEEVELEDELATGEKVCVMFDILRYTKKNTLSGDHGLSFKPTAIYFYPEQN